MIGCSRPQTTMAPLTKPAAQPDRITASVPAATCSGVPTTRAEAMQLVRMKIMPTERSRPRRQHRHRLRHRHERQQHGGIGGAQDHGRRIVGREIAEIEREHDDEDGDRQQQAVAAREPEAKSGHAGDPARRVARLHRQVERAGDDVALGDLAAAQFAQDAPVIEDGDAIAAADQLVIVGGVEQDGRAGVGKAAQQLVDLLLGADVDAAGGIVEQDDPGVRSSATWR